MFSFLTRCQKYLVKQRMSFVIPFLLLFLVLSFLWIGLQEIHFKDSELNPENAQTLISWELNRQLTILVIAFSSAIALITITLKNKITASAFVAGIIVAMINILSLSKLVQSFQFVIHYEQQVNVQIRTQIFSKWEAFYVYFFQESGKLNQLGWILTFAFIIIVTLLWISLLNSVEMKSK